MENQSTFPVPMWVRNIICITACISVPLMIVASYFGMALTPYLIAAVCFFAARTANFAFGGNKFL
ncbi:MAG: hypothetical protein OEZ33_07730 [Gammaproteobacteria bacterium]|nr:hypothetical protein [Gammaproteobacteria bacterium]MDH5778086.1 hypothetical protein [Gammaproteobacteria bacterium]